MMIAEAMLEPYHMILEPSAGIGSIVDRICELPTLQPNPKHLITCCEKVPALIDILMLKGYNVWPGDFKDMVGNGGHPEKYGFDRILMNPPFENGQDVDHIMHCFDRFLKVGGILVAVASMNWTFTTTKKSNAFRDFLDIPFEGPEDMPYNGTKYMQTLGSTVEIESATISGKVQALPDNAFNNAFKSASVQTTLITLKKK